MVKKPIPLVSVVIPIYNGEKFLDESIKSILTQTYKNIELILINDASTDNSQKIIDRFKNKNKNIIALSNSVNMGIAETRNIGARLATGKYYAPMDQDDISNRKRLEEEVTFLENNSDYAAVGTQVEIIDTKGFTIGVRKYITTYEDIIKHIGYQSPICNPSSMINWNNLKKVGFYNTSFPGAEDYDLWFKLANISKIGNLSKSLLQYRVGHHQTKRTHIKAIISYTQKIQWRWIFTKKIFRCGFVITFLLRYLLFLVPSFLIWKIFEKLSIRNTRETV